MQRLLIADSSACFVSALESALGKHFLIRASFDGNDALELLEQFQPDILIINLMLPYRDGLTVLQQTNFRPQIILAVTPYVNAYIQQTVSMLGIDFTMICPSVKALCARLQHLITSSTAQPESADPMEVMVHHLHKLNFSSHLDGYRQLCVAVPLYAKNPGQFMTKELYPTVAKQCGCTDGKCVERSIRKAIYTAWTNGDMAVWRKYFVPNPQGSVPCPTNKEFICRLTEFLSVR